MDPATSEAPPAPEPPPPPPAPEPAPAPPPAAVIPPPAPAAETEPRLGAGTLELRIQTVTHVSTGTLTLPPGLWYNIDDEAFSFNLQGGVGYFLSPSLAIGGDLGFAGNDDTNLLTIAPFVKFVTGLPERSTGFIAELSPGFVTQEFGDVNLLALTAFAGVHLPIGSTAAFVGGAQVSRLDDFDDFGEGITAIGLRYGLNFYL
jgi:hypothetical protein